MTQYQPNVPELSLAALSQLHERAQQSLGAVTATRIAYRMAVNDRKDSFAGIQKLAGRVTKMMGVYARGEQSHLEDAALLMRKFYSPKKKAKSAEDKTETNVTIQATRASGRKSFDQQMETFSNIVQLAQKIGNYNPAEADVSIKRLKQKLAELHARCEVVATTHAAFKNARLQRNEIVHGKDGVVKISKAVKAYVNAAFGKDSDQSKQIAGIS